MEKKVGSPVPGSSGLRDVKVEESDYSDNEFNKSRDKTQPRYKSRLRDVNSDEESNYSDDELNKSRKKKQKMTQLRRNPGLRDVDKDEESDYSNDELNKSRKKKRIIYLTNSDDSEMEIVGTVNYIYNRIYDYTQTVSEDNEKTFEVEDSESEEKLESEESEEYREEDAEDSKEWTSDGDLKQFVFEGKTGFQNFPKGPDPYDFFELLLDDDFFSMIVTETNDYLESAKGEKYKKLSVEEFKKFLGLLLHMGTIKCNQIQHYWSTHRLFNFNCFSQHMSRTRFQDILPCLRFASNDESSNPSSEIQPIIDYFNQKMKAIYYPQRELSIDETMVPWRGRLTFRQAIDGEKHKYGVKLYALTESSGMALRIKVSIGSEDVLNSKKHATKAVLSLLEDFLQRGHSVFMGQFCTSVALSEHLLDSKTHCTGILGKLRQGNSQEVLKAKLSEGEVISRYKNKIMMGMFRDKRDILFTSSEFKTNLVEVENKGRERYKKPLVLHKYDRFMTGIEKKDKMLSYYTCSRKNFKWYITLWINIVETLLLNSFFLYSKYSSVVQKLTFYDFRLNVIDALLFGNSPKNASVILPALEHTPEILSRGKNNKVKRKRCRYCFANNIRKETSYFCGACDGNPGLCLGTCFKEFHRKK